MDAMDEPRDEHRAEDPLVEQEPTVTYTPITAEPTLTEGPLVAGAFGFALIVERGPRAGLTYVLPEGVTTAGRDPESGIFLEDITVSRHHARFIVQDGTLTVEDLGSTNGTYVNGERRERTELQPNDEIFIGKFRLLVARGDV
jgi:pSer/pThr/pTyr-binding forkhead associated (FHA) protein